MPHTRTDLDRHVAMEGHYVSNSGPKSTIRQVGFSPRKAAVATHHTVEETRFQPNPIQSYRSGSTPALPREELASTPTQPKGQSKRNSTKGKAKATKKAKAQPYPTTQKSALAGYTIPKRRSSVPDQPVYSGPSTSSAGSGATVALPSTSAQATASPPADSILPDSNADLLEDAAWLASLLSTEDDTTKENSKTTEDDRV